MLRMAQPPVTRWHRVPAKRAVQLERLTQARETVESMRPDLRWVRVADPIWPHVRGRPLLDLVVDGRSVKPLKRRRP